MTTNRHPVDELADVREQIKKLQRREHELRTKLLIGGYPLIGDEYKAELIDQPRETLDTKAIKREFGLERLAPFIRATEVAIVKLERLGTNDANEWMD